MTTPARSSPPRQSARGSRVARQLASASMFVLAATVCGSLSTADAQCLCSEIPPEWADQVVTSQAMTIDCAATPSPAAAPGTLVSPSEIAREISWSRHFDEFSVLHETGTEAIVMGRSGKYEERVCLVRASRQQPWMVIRRDVVCRDCLLTQTSGQSVNSPTIDAPVNRGNVDYPAVPLEQMADVIVVLVPDEDFGLAPHERIVHGSVVRLDKGPAPHMIVFTAYSMLTPLEKGVPAKLFLKKFTDRDAYYIIGHFAVRLRE